jgi:hypothetical protein
MKKTFTIVALLLISILLAQAPAGFNYQAVVKNAAGQLVINQNVTMRFSLKQGSTSTTPIYMETHQVSTDSKSQINLIIGQGTASIGNFAQIDWSLTSLYYSIELNTGSGYVTVASNDLISVPYAMYANIAGSTKIPSLAEVLQRGNDATAKKITNLATPVDPKDGVNVEYLATLKTKLDNQALKIKATTDTLIKKGLIQPQIEWEKDITSPTTFNNNVDVKQTQDGGFVLLSIGSNVRYQSISDKIIISRLTKEGTMLWQKVFDYQSLRVDPQRIIETTDLGFIICGSGKLVKLNSAGNIVWQNNVFQSVYQFNNVFQSADGIIFCNGFTVAKLDNNGNFLWQRYLVDNPSSINHIQPTFDGGIIAIGRSYVSIEKDFDAILFKLDTNGNTIWSKTFGGINSEDAQRITQTKDGGFLFEGYTNSLELSPNGFGSWIVKTNGLGDLQWQKVNELLSYGFTTLHKNIVETNDLSILHVVPSSYGYSIRKLSSIGNFQWEKAIKKTKWNTNWQLFSYFTPTNDNGLLVTELYEQESQINVYSQPTSTQLRLIKLNYKL